MKQMFFVEEAAFHGMPVRAAKLCAGAARLGRDVMLVLPTNGGAFTEAARESGVRVSEVKLIRFRDSGNPVRLVKALASFWPTICRLFMLMRAEKVAVVHCFGPHHILGPIAGRLAGVKVVWHMGGVYQWKGIRQPILHWLVNQGADLVVSNCKAVADTWVTARTLRKGRSVVIPSPVDTVAFRPGLDTRAVREELRCDDEDLVISTVAAIYPLKGIDWFMRSAAALQSRMKRRIKFLVIGPKLDLHHQYYSDMVELRDSLGLRDNLFFLGVRRDIPQLLNLSTVVVISSLTEGFPNVGVEAMACGRPLVATAVGGVPELVKDGVTGFVVPPADVQAMTDRLQCLVEDQMLREEVGKAARKEAEDRFSLDAIAMRVTGLFSDDCAAPKGSETNGGANA